MVLMNGSGKMEAFLENAGMLYDLMGITPLLYGSLGLQYLTGNDLSADDIDMLIPGEFVGARWAQFTQVLEAQGYVLIDEHEHTFEKGGIHYAYAQIEGLESFAGIRMDEIKTVCEKNVRFKLLSLEQYLSVYTASSKDGYRMNVKEKRDMEKIALIKKKMHKE